MDLNDPIPLIPAAKWDACLDDDEQGDLTADDALVAATALLIYTAAAILLATSPAIVRAAWRWAR